MKAEYINPFYKATIDVFKMMLDLEVARDKNGNVKKDTHNDDIHVCINITGDLTGFIVYSFNGKMPLEMVKIMSGMEIDEFDSFVSSALKEIANIISGNAVTGLTAQSMKCDITTPEIYSEENIPVGLADKQILRLPLHTILGDMQLSISLEEA